MSDNGKPPICGGADGERWLPVVGYEGLYAVSDHGRVWSAGRDVGGLGNRAPKILRLGKHGRGLGHLGLSLTDIDGFRRSVNVHQLVAEAFIGPSPFPGAVVRHLDDNTSDNTPGNLAWGTRADNQRDAVRNGRNANAVKELCATGHEFTDLNTIPWANPNGGVTRVCRACVNGSNSHSRAQDTRWTKEQMSNAWYRRHLDIGLGGRMSAAEMMERYGQQ